MSPTPTLEQRAAQALTDEGAPADLAPQLCAIASKYGLPDAAVLTWIRHHYDTRQWTGDAFRAFADAYATTAAALAARQRTDLKPAIQATMRDPTTTDAEALERVRGITAAGHAS